MPSPLDLTGKKFNKLLALKSVLGHSRLTGVTWLFKCDCGKTHYAKASAVTRGRTKSCGCQRIDSAKTGNSSRSHDLSKSRFYHIWWGMRRRCEYPSEQNYPRYGGKGIKVSKVWQKFENFRNDMYKSYLNHVKKFGEKQTTIDRIDNMGNYELLNCRWATLIEQRHNRRTK